MGPRIYLYKMTTDNGGAPCVRRGLLSLAICKGVIRRMAEEGSIIFGFGGKEYRERLIYIAVVTDKLDTGQYYWDPKYKNRPDCIYEMRDGAVCLKDGAKYHTESDELVRDVGMKFENANVLLSKDFRYFGKAGTCKYKEKYEVIKAAIEGMGRAYRVNLKESLREQLLKLKSEKWQNRAKKQGEPISSDKSKRCNEGLTKEVCG